MIGSWIGVQKALAAAAILARLNSLSPIAITAPVTLASTLDVSDSATITKSTNSAFIGLNVKNTSTGASASSRFYVENNSSDQMRLTTYGSGVTGTGYGVTLARYMSIESTGAGNGLIIGTNNSGSTPLIFGIGGNEVARFSSAGSFTTLQPININGSSGQCIILNTTDAVNGTFTRWRNSSSDIAYIGAAPGAAGVGTIADFAINAVSGSLYFFGGGQLALQYKTVAGAANIGFLGATPIPRPGATTDLRSALISLGLYTSGGATPLDLNQGQLTAGNLNITAGAASLFTGAFAADYLVKVACGSGAGDGIRVQAGGDSRTAYAVRNAASAISWSVLGSGDMTANTVTAFTTDAGTATQPSLVTLLHKSSGTPASGFGDTLTLAAASNGSTQRSQVDIASAWVTATDASRTARGYLYAYDTLSRECIRWEASGTAAMLGFLGASAIARFSTTGTATGFTAGAGTTVTDQSTFTGGSGATAYRISDLVLAMKSYGLLVA